MLVNLPMLSNIIIIIMTRSPDPRYIVPYPITVKSVFLLLLSFQPKRRMSERLVFLVGKSY